MSACLEMRLMNHMIVLILLSGGTAIMTVLIYVHTNNVKCFIFFTSSPALVFFNLSVNSLSYFIQWHSISFWFKIVFMWLLIMLNITSYTYEYILVTGLFLLRACLLSSTTNSIISIFAEVLLLVVHFNSLLVTT